MIPLIGLKIADKRRGTMGPDPISDLASFLSHTSMAGRHRNILDLRNKYERENDFLIVLPAPGVEKDGVKLEIKDDTMTVKVSPNLEVLSPNVASGGNDLYDPISVDFYADDVEFNVDLDGMVNPDKVKAGLKNGVLIITLPKAEEKKGRTIKVD